MNYKSTQEKEYEPVNYQGFPGQSYQEKLTPSEKNWVWVGRVAFALLILYIVVKAIL